MVINVHAGHCPYKKGAYGAVSILNESIENRIVKDEVIRLLREKGHTVYDCTVDYRTTRNGCLRDIVTKCNKHKVDLDISIHLNSGRNDKKGNGDAGGAECHIFNDKTRDVALRIAKNIDNELGIGLHGKGIVVNPSLAVLKNTKSPAILVECCYVDDKDDALRWDAKKCAKAIVEGILGMNITPSNPKPQPPKPQTPSNTKPSAPHVKDYLQKGDRGNEVKSMQKMLIISGYSCGRYGADGVFGSDAENAVKSFQRDNGLTPDGIYGKNTKPKLMDKYKKVCLDGIWGRGVTVSLQTIFGTVIDGIVSNQPSCNRKYLSACSSNSWNFIDSNFRYGSTLLKKLQERIGISASGRDGFFGKTSVKALQKYLKANGYSCGTTGADGYLGSKTVIALQKWIIANL